MSDEMIDVSSDLAPKVVKHRSSPGSCYFLQQSFSLKIKCKLKPVMATNTELFDSMFGQKRQRERTKPGTNERADQRHRPAPTAGVLRGPQLACAEMRSALIELWSGGPLPGGLIQQFSATACGCVAVICLASAASLQALALSPPC